MKNVGDDLTKIESANCVDIHLSLMVGPNVKDLSPSISPEVWEDLFMLQIQVQQKFINVIR